MEADQDVQTKKVVVYGDGRQCGRTMRVCVFQRLLELVRRKTTSVEANPLAPVAFAAAEATQAEARWEVTNFNHTMIDIAGGSYAWGPDYQQVLSHLRETESQLATAQAQYADSIAEAKAEIERLTTGNPKRQQETIAIAALKTSVFHERHSFQRVYGSTAGPFGGIGGAAMTPFWIDVYVAEDGRYIEMCGMKVIKAGKDYQSDVRKAIERAEAEATKWKGLYDVAWDECNGWRGAYERWNTSDKCKATMREPFETIEPHDAARREAGLGEK